MSILVHIVGRPGHGRDSITMPDGTRFVRVALPTSIHIEKLGPGESVTFPVRTADLEVHRGRCGNYFVLWPEGET